MVREKVLSKAEKSLNKQITSKGKKGEDSEVLIDYELFNLYDWLLKCAPDSPTTKSKMEKIRRKHPDFQPREHPDFGFYWEVREAPYLTPISADELIQSRPPSILPFLLEFQEKDFFKPNRSGLLNVVEKAVSSSPKWGLELAWELEKEGKFQVDLWEKILGGWIQAKDMKEEEWEGILGFLEKNHENLGLPWKISLLLNKGFESSSSPLPSAFYDKALNLSKKLWKLADIPFTVIEQNSKDWVTQAINHPGGVIVEFWIRFLSNQLKFEKEPKKKIFSKFKELLEEVVNGTSPKSQTGIVILMGELHFFFDIDPDWTIETLIPLLDWENNKTSLQLQAWQGFLWWAKINKALIPHLIPLYEQAVENFPREPREFRERLIEHLAIVMLENEILPSQKSLLKVFLSIASIEEKEGFAMGICRALKEYPEEYRNHIWNWKLKSYWEDRINGIPLKLEPEEVSQMIEWVFPLKSVASEVISLFCSSPTPSPPSVTFFHELKKTDLPDKDPQSTAELILKFAPSTTPWDWQNITEIIKNLKEKQDPKVNELITKICEELASAGCTAALDLFES